MAEPEVIDRTTLDVLLQLVDCDSAFLNELIDAYLADAPGQLAAMRQASASGDAAELRRAAHSLKANSASFGATRLADLCAGIEARAAAGATGVPAALVAAAEAEYDQVRRALREMRAAE